MASPSVNTLLSIPAPGKILISQQSLKTHYVRWGEGDIPLLFLHKVSGGGETWQPVLGDFEKDFDIIAPDLFGHGYSSIVDDYSLDMFAHQILALVEGLKIKQPIHLVGHSLGARVALKVATIADASTVASLSCIEPPLSGPGQPAYPFSLRSIQDWQQGVQEQGIEYCLKSNASYSYREAELRARYGLLCDQNVFEAVWRGFENENMGPLIQSVRCPFQLMYGDQGVIGQEQIEKVKHWNPNVILKKVHRCGHNPPWENRKSFSAESIGFLRSIQAVSEVVSD